MLADDANRLKNLIKTKSWDVLLTQGHWDKKNWLINLARSFFVKEADFANPKTGHVTKQEYVDYDSYTLEQVVEVIKQHRTEIMKGW